MVNLAQIGKVNSQYAAALHGVVLEKSFRERGFAARFVIIGTLIHHSSIVGGHAEMEPCPFELISKVLRFAGNDKSGNAP